MSALGAALSRAGGAALAALARLVAGPAVVRRPGAPATDEPAPAPARVYVANHASHLDLLVLWAALPPRERRRTRPVAAADYWGRRGLRWFSRGILRALLVRRDGGPTAGSEAVAAMCAALDAGAALVVFPEGTRSADGALGAFRAGLYWLCRARPHTEVVPVHLGHLARVLPKGEFAPVPRLTRVVVGPALRLGADEPKADFLARARQAVADLAHDAGPAALADPLPHATPPASPTVPRDDARS